MHKHISFVIITAVLITAIATVALYTVNAAHAQEQQQVGQAQVNKLWETPANLKNPESVTYASKQNILFVSNINGDPVKKESKWIHFQGFTF